MLQPPRKLTNTPAGVARPWGNSQINASVADPSHQHKGGAVTPLRQGSGVGEAASPTPLLGGLVASPMDYHERDAPALSPRDAWRQRTVRSSVEAYGSNGGSSSSAVLPTAVIPKVGGPQKAHANSSDALDSSDPRRAPLFAPGTAPKSSAAPSIGIAGLSGQHNHQQPQPVGEMRPVGASGLFKVFRPHYQSEWWQTSNAAYDPISGAGNALLATTSGYGGSMARDAAAAGGQRTDSRVPFVAAAMAAKNNTAAARSGHSSSTAVPSPANAPLIPSAVARPKAVEEALAGLTHSMHSASSATTTTGTPPPMQPMHLRKHADVYAVPSDASDAEAAAIANYELATGAGALAEHTVAERRRNLLFPPTNGVGSAHPSSHNVVNTDPANVSSRSPRMGVANAGLSDNTNGQFGFGRGNGRSLEEPSTSKNNNKAHPLLPFSSALVVANNHNPTTPQEMASAASAESSRAVALSSKHLHSTDLIIANDERGDLLAELEALRDEAARLRHQNASSERAVQKYEAMLGPLDQFAAQQVHLREEVVRLRDEVLRLEGRDESNKGRIDELEGMLRRAGYSSNGPVNAATSSTSTNAALPSSSSATFVEQSQRRLEELQARLARALTLKGHLAAQREEVEGLAETYNAVDDVVSPVKGLLGLPTSASSSGRHTAAPDADQLRDQQKVALLDSKTHHSWRMRGKAAEIELKLRTQEDLIKQLTAAIEAQREALGSEQAKLRAGAAGNSSSPSKSSAQRPASPSAPNSGDNNKGIVNRVPAAVVGGAKAGSGGGKAAHEAATDALLAAVTPGAEAEIQRLLAVVNAKNGQIVQMRRLLEAVAKSGRIGLGGAGDLNSGIDASVTTGTTALPTANANASPLRSLPPTDVHGQLLMAAAAADDARDGVTYMTNADGERATADDILYPHQRPIPSALLSAPGGGISGGGVDHVALAQQLWRLESENAALNQRLTEAQLASAAKDSRIAELEALVLASPGRRSAPSNYHSPHHGLEL